MSRFKVWLPVALKALGIVGILLVLAGIGSVSLLYGWNGVAIARGAPSATASVGSEWLATPGDDTVTPAEEAAEADAGPPVPGQKVILNTATAEELTRLPGVGVRRADAIVKLRTRLKRFRRPTDLLRVRGIGPRSLKRMLPHLVLDPPTQTSATDAGARD